MMCKMDFEERTTLKLPGLSEERARKVLASCVITISEVISCQLATKKSSIFCYAKLTCSPNDQPCENDLEKSIFIHNLAQLYRRLITKVVTELIIREQT